MHSRNFTHGRVGADIFTKVHGVQVFDSNPAEDRSRLFYVRATTRNEFSDEVGKCFLVFLCHLRKFMEGI